MSVFNPNSSSINWSVRDDCYYYDSELQRVEPSIINEILAVTGLPHRYAKLSNGKQLPLACLFRSYRECEYAYDLVQGQNALSIASEIESIEDLIIFPLDHDVSKDSCYKEAYLIAASKLCLAKKKEGTEIL